MAKTRTFIAVDLSPSVRQRAANLIERLKVRVGDAVLIPAGEDHWHGAGDTGSPMSHLTVMQAGSQTTLIEE